MNKFRIRYEIREDTYYLETFYHGNKEWGLVMAQKCVPASGQPHLSEYIHYSMLVEVQKLLQLGYKMVW